MKIAAGRRGAAICFLLFPDFSSPSLFFLAKITAKTTWKRKKKREKLSGLCVSRPHFLPPPSPPSGGRRRRCCCVWGRGEGDPFFGRRKKPIGKKKERERGVSKFFLSLPLPSCTTSLSPLPLLPFFSRTFLPSFPPSFAATFFLSFFLPSNPLSPLEETLWKRKTKKKRMKEEEKKVGGG